MKTIISLFFIMGEVKIMYRLLVILISLSVSFNAYTRDPDYEAFFDGIPEVKAFFDAVEKGDISGFDLKANPDLIHSRDLHRDTPLHRAAWHAHNEIMVQLIKAGADVNARSYAGTPLNRIWRHNLEGLNILIKAGVDVNVQGMHGTTALMAACISNNEEFIIPLLKAGADVDIKDEHGKTALSWAVRFPRSISTINHLVEAGADVSVIKQESNVAFNWLAGMRDQDQATSTIAYLIKMGADADALSVQNIDSITDDTPLHYAAGHGQEKIVAQMLKYGADPSIKNKKGNTAYCEAKKRGYVSIMKLLDDKRFYYSRSCN